ncbi:SDR family oxidoreductase [Bengtsoniella intestinalis]|uniref:elongation factor P 5-aminopentanone reductase n=1 Tax=Bengtsoniella intestinalis TaxID=3073143 RepID=UPI00391F4F49
MGKIALVTGGSRGIGRAIALELGHRGYDVCVHYQTNQTLAQEVADSIAANGGTAMTYGCDIADSTAVEAMVAEIYVTLGQVSLLVNNAGMAHQGLFQDMDDDLWNRMLAVNLTGTRNTIRAVLPAMIGRKRGTIINISSIWGLRGASCEVAYAATKGAIIAMTRSLALELAPSGIRVNCVAPGCIETDMTASLGAETLAQLAEETPLGRLGTPADIAKVVTFLASPDASFVTGQVLTADGGLTV